jgi:hypothetical protein
VVGLIRAGRLGVEYRAEVIKKLDSQIGYYLHTFPQDTISSELDVIIALHISHKFFAHMEGVEISETQCAINIKKEVGYQELLGMIHTKLPKATYKEKLMGIKK